MNWEPPLSPPECFEEKLRHLEMTEEEYFEYLDKLEDLETL